MLPIWSLVLLPFLTPDWTSGSSQFTYCWSLAWRILSILKEIEENNKMGKTRDLFKKIRDTKGTFHAKMGSIKDRNGVDVGNLISGSSAFSKSSLNIWKFTVYILLKPGLENFEHYFSSLWDECNCAVVWAFFGSAFLRDCKEKGPFPVLWPLLSFPNLLAYWV